MSNGNVLLIQDSSGAIKRAKSENEYIFHIALIAEKVQFLYEFALYGGHAMLGGVSIDFLCWVPFSTAVEIIGPYWHRNTSRERWRMAIIASYFGREPVEITLEETEDVGASRAAIKKKLK